MSGETVDDMFGRVNVLLNELDTLGYRFSKTQINLKLLDNMPKVLEPKTIVLFDARNLKELMWDEF